MIRNWMINHGIGCIVQTDKPKYLALKRCFDKRRKPRPYSLPPVWIQITSCLDQESDWNELMWIMINPSEVHLNSIMIFFNTERLESSSRLTTNGPSWLLRCYLFVAWGVYGWHVFEPPVTDASPSYPHCILINSQQFLFLNHLM